MTLFRTKDEEFGSGSAPSMSTPRSGAVSALATQNPPDGMAAPVATPPGYNRTKDPLQNQYKLTRSNYDNLTAQSTELNRQRKALLSQPGLHRSLILPRPDSFAPPKEQFDGVPGVGDAVAELDRRLQPLGEQRRALIPEFQRQTQAFREQISKNEANVALQRVGAAPIASVGSSTTPANTDPSGISTSKPQGQTAAAQSQVSQPAGAASTDIIGTFNGRQITRAQSDTLAGKLPTVGGGGLADAVGVQPAAPVLARQNTAAAYGAPSAPQAAPADLRAANEADAKLRSDIDSQLFRLSFAAGRPGRDGREAKQAMADLVGLQQRSVDGQGKRAVDVAGGDRNAVLDTNRNNAGLATSDADRALRAQQGSEALQLNREGQNRGGQVLTGEDGTASLLRPDGSLAPLTSADGGAFRPRAAPTAGEITPAGRLDFIGKQIEAVQKAMSSPLTDPKAQEGFKAQLDSLNQQAAALTAQKATPTSAQIAKLKANPDQAADFDSLFGKGAAAKLLGK